MTEITGLYWREPVEPGQRVRMDAAAYAGRTGTVVRKEWIDAGGADRRPAVVVDLDPTDRAQGRRIRCYQASYSLLPEQTP